MHVRDVARRLILRWDRIGLLLLLLLPTIISSVLGFVWLREHDLLMIFFAAVAAAGAIFVLLRLLVRRLLRPSTPVGSMPDIPSVRAEPDWTPKERATFDSACRMIHEFDTSSAPWADLPIQAIKVLEHAASTLSDGRRSMMDFSVPEALLLVDRVVIRYRSVLRSHVPFSDQFSVGMALWLFRHRGIAQALGSWGMRSWRVIRLVSNPPAGLLQELGGLMMSGASEALSAGFQRELKCLLLEEVAHAAVELYSGRLRFSDAELLEIELQSSGQDRDRIAQTDEPVRILVVGQISSGKSTLVNALLRENRAETDMAPTTTGLHAYEFEIAGLPCRLLDTMGLDGSVAMRDRVAGEMAQSDLVLWAVRTDRPARAPDAALMQAYLNVFLSLPQRRRPPLVVAATFADRLAPVREAPEGWLELKERERVGQALAAISSELLLPPPIPTCAEEPEWNVSAVAIALEASMGEALMTQRNRRRLQGEAESSIWTDASRAWRGGHAVVAEVGGRLFPKATSTILAAANALKPNGSKGRPNS